MIELARWSLVQQRHHELDRDHRQYKNQSIIGVLYLDPARKDNFTWYSKWMSGCPSQRLSSYTCTLPSFHPDGLHLNPDRVVTESPCRLTVSTASPQSMTKEVLLGLAPLVRHLLVADGS